MIKVKRHISVYSLEGDNLIDRYEVGNTLEELKEIFKFCDFSDDEFMYLCYDVTLEESRAFPCRFNFEKFSYQLECERQ